MKCFWMRRFWWSCGIAVVVTASGCIAPQTAVVPGYSYGRPVAGAVANSCDPCGTPVVGDPCAPPQMCAPPMVAGYGYAPVFGGGTLLRATAFGVENCVNTTGNVVAGVIAFPFHVVGGVTRYTLAGLGRLGTCASGCGPEVYRGDFGYQRADFCDPCTTGSYGGYAPMGRGAVMQSDCGCDGGSEPAMPIPASDEIVTVRRPSRIAATRAVTTASFNTPATTATTRQNIVR